MIGSHDVLPVDAALDLPRPARLTLVDLGLASNATAEFLNQALSMERIAAAAHTDAVYGGAAAAFRARTWDAAWACALSHVEQLTAVYTQVCATYAVCGALVARHVLRGEHPPPLPQRVLPSQLVQPQRLPLVELPDRSDRRLVEHARVLLTAHRAVMQAAEHVRDCAVAGEYDDTRRAAARQVGSVDLDPAFGIALHAYAAACTWALTLTGCRLRTDQQR